MISTSFDTRHLTVTASISPIVADPAAPTRNIIPLGIPVDVLASRRAAHAEVVGVIDGADTVPIELVRVAALWSVDVGVEPAVLVARLEVLERVGHRVRGSHGIGKSEGKEGMCKELHDGVCVLNSA